MKAVVVYESIWGNTKDVAKAIAEGIGPEAEAYSTDEIRPEVAAEADLIVAGAPIQGFSLPNARMRAGILPDTEPRPDLSAPTLRAWLEQLPGGDRPFAAFDTKIRWSPGSAARAQLSGASHRQSPATAPPKTPLRERRDMSIKVTCVGIPRWRTAAPVLRRHRQPKSWPGL